jgi:energy-coupling factor transporter ATP-binding protein EcfA2
MQIPVVGQLVGVVGPNGCGKSNIIDAVRWVLGEVRPPAELRGESMQDVIFNGSAERKPVVRASVELLFDNRDGRARRRSGRPFAEIAVAPRADARSGASSYYINNLPVRRRDVAGPVPRHRTSVPAPTAIIEQGMVSRIVEARPEELRVFLEEAAGVALPPSAARRPRPARRRPHQPRPRRRRDAHARRADRAPHHPGHRCPPLPPNSSTELRDAQSTLLGLRAFLASEQARAATAASAATETAIEAGMAGLRCSKPRWRCSRPGPGRHRPTALGRAAGGGLCRRRRGDAHRAEPWPTCSRRAPALAARIEAQQRRQAEEVERGRQLGDARGGWRSRDAAAAQAAADTGPCGTRRTAESAAQAAEAAEVGGTCRARRGAPSSASVRAARCRRPRPRCGWSSSASRRPPASWRRAPDECCRAGR